MNPFFRILIIFLFSVNSFAEVVCINNAKEYLELKEKLPVLFQKLPIKLGGEKLADPSYLLSYDVFATLTISLHGDAIVLKTDSWQGPKGHVLSKKPEEVKSVCFDSTTKKMKIRFVVDAEEFTAVYTDTEVRHPQVTLKKISATQERAILEKIYKKVPGKALPIIETPSSQMEIK